VTTGVAVVLTLVTDGTVVLSFNGVGASVPLTVTAGSTTAANVLASLNSIPGQNGNFSVTGSDGGPFKITLIGSLARQNVSQLASSSSAVASLATVGPLPAHGD